MRISRRIACGHLGNIVLEGRVRTRVTARIANDSTRAMRNGARINGERKHGARAVRVDQTIPIRVVAVQKDLDKLVDASLLILSHARVIKCTQRRRD